MQEAREQERAPTTQLFTGPRRSSLDRIVRRPSLEEAMEASEARNIVEAITDLQSEADGFNELFKSPAAREVPPEAIQATDALADHLQASPAVTVEQMSEVGTMRRPRKRSVEGIPLPPTRRSISLDVDGNELHPENHVTSPSWIVSHPRGPEERLFGQGLFATSNDSDSLLHQMYMADVPTPPKPVQPKSQG